MTINPANKTIQYWHGLMILAVLAMILLGGLTRLTDSGLSITEWKPVMGAIPPMSLQDWEEVFLKYQQTTEYQVVNKGMTLDEFKTIYWWEFLHRLLGRLIGVIVLLPLIYFSYKKMISSKVKKLVFTSFILGGMQGALGWYMVVSGLTDRVDVSHYRLTMHLCLAFAILAVLTVSFFETLDFKEKIKNFHLPSHFNFVSVLIFLALVLQIIYGGFNAGLKAGLIAHTYPDMNGVLIPEGMFGGDLWMSLTHNPVTVQFLHRWFAYVVVGGILYLAHYFYHSKHKFLQNFSFLLVVTVFFQVIIGIATVMMKLQIVMAALHQIVGAILFMQVISAFWIISKYSKVQNSYQPSQVVGHV